VEQWKKRDPLLNFRGHLEAAGLLSTAQAAELDARAVAEVEDAVRFAQEAPYPDVSRAAEGVYAPLDEE
jgi:TPP-dependent pyruvate/acetoin dehydrogenase alpha subunit